MDHAAAHERIADLALESGAPERLAASTEPRDVALREHLARCEACSAELAGWRDVQSLVHASLASTSLVADVTDAGPPAALRQRVIDATTRSRPPTLQVAVRPASEPVSLRSSRLRRFGRVRALPRLPIGLAAVLALVVTAGVVGVGVERVRSAEAERAALGSVVATLDRVLAAPQHVVIPLRSIQPGAMGSAGSVSWTAHDLVVLTTALEAPRPNEVYRCYLLPPNGSGHAIGAMSFAGSTAYWAASVDDWAWVKWTPGSMFVVSLEDATLPDTGPHDTILEADLGS